MSTNPFSRKCTVAADCSAASVACGVCCAPWGVARAFEELHTFHDCAPGVPGCGWACPRTCLGCAMCAGGPSGWVLAYVASHNDDQVGCADTFFRLMLCGYCCCYPVAMATELRRQTTTGGMHDILL